MIAKGDSVPVLANAARGMYIKVSRIGIAQLCTAEQSSERVEVDMGFNKRVVILSKRCKGFNIGREIAF